MSVEEEEKEEVDYKILLSLFLQYLEDAYHGSDGISVLEEIIVYRASHLIERVLDGFGVTIDQAINLMRENKDFLTVEENERRILLIAAIDNLIDFATAQEFHVMSELPKKMKKEDEKEYKGVFKKYNKIHAKEENRIVSDAVKMAVWFSALSPETSLTFMTQADERVRAWHLSLEGTTYLKRDFPPDLIPPIEWGCRCFLIPDYYGAVSGSLKKKLTNEKINPVFSESLAKGGKVFSSSHPYFKQELSQEFILIKEKLKRKLLNPDAENNSNSIS